jgi:hypothetical protein
MHELYLIYTIYAWRGVWITNNLLSEPESPAKILADQNSFILPLKFRI